jgi:hypothetical protein
MERLIKIAGVLYAPCDGTNHFSLQTMAAFCGEAWGAAGLAAVRMWARLNETYFGGTLRPIPIIFIPISPDNRVADYHDGENGRMIRLVMPSDGRTINYAENLIHEMSHQAVAEQGRDPSHASADWRKEIRRLSMAIGGHDIEIEKCSERYLAQWPSNFGVNLHSVLVWP